MKLAKLTTVALACALFSGTAAASSGSLNEFRPRVMPVLVNVNSHGKVTEASPAIELPPQLRRLLRANLDEMIRKPAIDKHGRPISSQFIMNLALQASPLPNGNYDAHFAYLSTAPVPSGSWYWVHIDGHRLALARQDSTFGEQRIRYHQERYQPSYQRSYERSPSPPINNASRSAPEPTAAAPQGR